MQAVATVGVATVGLGCRAVLELAAPHADARNATTTAAMNIRMPLQTHRRPSCCGKMPLEAFAPAEEGRVRRSLGFGSAGAFAEEPLRCPAPPAVRQDHPQEVE